jgi:hypothetical protein
MRFLLILLMLSFLGCANTVTDKGINVNLQCSSSMVAW